MRQKSNRRPERPRGSFWAIRKPLRLASRFSKSARSTKRFARCVSVPIQIRDTLIARYVCARFRALSGLAHSKIGLPSANGAKKPGLAQYAIAGAPPGRRTRTRKRCGRATNVAQITGAGKGKKRRTRARGRFSTDRARNIVALSPKASPRVGLGGAAYFRFGMRFLRSSAFGT